MDRKKLVEYYNSLIDQYPDKEDLIYDGIDAIHAGGIPITTFPDIDTVISAGERARGKGPSEISKGFEKATKEMKASGYGAMGLVGSAVGSDKLRDYGYEGYKRNMAEAEEVAPRVNKVEDIGSFSDATDWFMGTLGSLGPSVLEAGAAALAGGGIGGLAARKAGKEAIESAVEKYVAKKVGEGILETEARAAARDAVAGIIKSGAMATGRKVGLVAGVAPVESGSMFGQSADEVGVENVNPYVTGLMGTISAASELAGPEGELLTNGIKKFGRGTIVADLVKSAAKEGGQEVVQQGLGDVNRLVNNPDATLSGSDYLNAFAAGSIGGLSFGAPSAARGLMSPKAPQDMIKSAKGETAPVETSVVDESPVVDGQSVNPDIVPLPRSPLPGIGVVKSKDIEPLPGMGIFNQESPMASGLQVNPNVAPVESVQPMPVEEQPAVNSVLQIGPDEQIQEPDVFNSRAEVTLDDGIKYTYGENKAGKPAIFAHDQSGKLLDAVTYKNHGIASNEFMKLTEPAKGLSLDKDEFGGMGLPVYESKPTDIPVSPQINMAEELGDKPVSSPEKAPTSDRKPYMDFVEKKVKELGSSEAVNDFYKTDKPVDQYARDYAKSVYGEAKKPVKEPFKAPEGVKLTSTGGPFKISGAKKAAANHTKKTGEAAEVVDLGGGNFGWKVSEKKENRTLDSTGRVEDGVGISDDEVFTMASGRKTTPYPKYTHLKSESAKSLKSDKWIIENAISEAKERGDDFNGNWINRLKPGKLSPSDYDSLNMYLFDGEMDKILSESKQKKILRPLVVNETHVDAPQTDLTLKSDTQKEPWQMPRDKFIDYAEKEVGKKRTDINETGLSTAGTSYEDIWKSTHESEVKKALDSGMAVPDEVMAEYPKLKKKEPAISKTETTESKADQPSVETVTEPVKAESSQTEKETAGSPESNIADFVKQKLESGDQITSAQLFEQADKAYNGSQGQGSYSVKDAYDAMELGVNKYIESMKISPDVSIEKAIENVKSLSGITDLLATQTKRTKEQNEYQQFSTPPAFGYVANWVSGVKKGDQFLEPSAGIGGLAVFAKNAGATVYVNEFSPRRANIIKEMGFKEVFTEDAEQLDNVIPDYVKPNVIVMNPPFSATAGRTKTNSTMNGAKHIEQALLRLEDGGRLVAIVGQGMSMDATTFRPWWDSIKKKYNVRANVGVSGKEYAKYGTTFDNQILVIDKTGVTADTIIGKVESFSDLIPMLKDLREEGRYETKQPDGDKISEQIPREQGGAEIASNTERADSGRKDTLVSTDGMGDGKQGGNADRNPGIDNSIIPKDSAKKGDGSTESDRGEKPSRESKGTGSKSDSGSGSLDTGRSAGLSSGDFTQAEKRNDEITDSVYDRYQPNIKIPGSKTHVTPLVESSAMADTKPPSIKYVPNIPIDTIKKGLLTDAQLEAITFAGASFQKKLPNGTRRGFFIGDGTGVGKGREISGIIYDNWRNGSKKAIWLSEKSSLLNDAKRDLQGIGWAEGAEKVFSVNDAKLGEPIKNEDGILFTQYATLRGKFNDIRLDQENSMDDMNIRLNQIVKWAGKDFDGVIAFDEAHNMGNVLPVKGLRGAKKPANQALAGVLLQEMLPNAKIVYVSATGATEVSNLAYATRLGLWGDGTPFRNANDFVDKIAGSGISAMELVARDMKSLGLYIARSLSYADVKYERLEHELSPQQVKIYDTMAKGWQTVLANINEAIEVTEGGKNARSAALSQFWGAHQRFFNQIITALQMPTALDQMEKDIAAGKSIVIQLVSTNASQTEKKLAELGDDMEIEDLDMTPRDSLMQFLERSFPTQQYEEYTDQDGNLRSRPVYDSKGKPVLNKEAVRMKNALIREMGSMSVPETSLDMILNRLGPDIVAEVTGRKRRVINDKDGNKTIEKWSDAKSQKDIRDFMDDKKKVLIFSEKGGTGSSYHAAMDAKNQRLRRHYLIQPGWRADKAVQGLGRSHRSFQKQAPEFILVTTDLPGQKRFLSSIARRLDQLGALTKGQRQTGSQGIFAAKDNLESTHAKDALEKFFNNLMADKYTDLDVTDFESQTGLSLFDKEGNGKETPEMTQFLNRILSMTKDTQEKVFNYFSKELDDVIQYHSDLGTLDVGLETITADSVKLIKEETAFKNEKDNIEAKYLKFELKHPARNETFEQALADKPTGFYINKTSGRIRSSEKIRERTDSKTGTIEKYVTLKNPKRNVVRVSVDELAEKWELVSRKEAEKIWNAEYKTLPKHNTETLHMLTGTLLPLWDRLEGKAAVARLQTDDGERYLGRKISSESINTVMENLGMGKESIAMDGEAVAENVMNGGTITLHNKTQFKRSRVGGENRIEYVSTEQWGNLNANQMENFGLFSEVIQWKTRWFVPVGDQAGSVIDKVMLGKDIVSAQTATRKVNVGDVKYSKSTQAGPTATISELSKPQRAEVEKLQKAGKVTMATEQEAIEALKQAGLSAERAKYMVAYHGTPHDFDQFSMDKIGTGEGAQAYGYGLYFAGNKEVAKHYRNTLSNQTWDTVDGPITESKLLDNMVSAMERSGNITSLHIMRNVAWNIVERLEKSKNIAKYIKDYTVPTGTYERFYIPAIEELKRLKVKKGKQGSLYQVELAPKEDEYLLWDGLIDEQGDKIKSLLEKTEYWEYAEDRLWGKADRSGTNPTGRDLYRDLLEDYDPKEASEFLKSIGIRGIKYLDGSSRGKGEGNYNYVIFDDADVKITAKYSKDGKIQGFVLPDGKAYIIPENIQQGKLWSVIRHEIGVHMGQLMQNRPEFNRILKTLENLKKSDTKQGELVRKAFDRVPKDTKPEHIAEEALAYLVESAPEIGIVRRFITMVKRLLVKMGVSPMIFNQADYAALADAAIRKEAGRVPGRGKTIGLKMSYAGQGAMTANSKALNKARQMLEKGMDPERVRRRTGWFKGLDGAMRFEISDRGMALKPKKYWAMNYGAKLSDVISHPKLFAAYPDLKDVSVIIDEDLNRIGANAQYNPNNNTIILSTKTVGSKEKDVLEAMIHEIQHGIQYKEGFDTTHFEKKYEPDYNDRYTAYRSQPHEAEAFDTTERLRKFGIQRRYSKPYEGQLEYIEEGRVLEEKAYAEKKSRDEEFENTILQSEAEAEYVEWFFDTFDDDHPALINVEADDEIPSPTEVLSKYGDELSIAQKAKLVRWANRMEENVLSMKNDTKSREPLYSISDAKDHITEAFDDALEFSKDLYERKGEILSGAKATYKYRKDKGKNFKEDTTWIEKSFGLVSHYAKKIPAFARTFNAALRNGELKTMIEQSLTHGAGGERFIETINTFRRKFKSEYRKLDRYLHDRDLNQVGYRVKTVDPDQIAELGGKYIIVDLEGKDTRHIFESKREAFEKITDLEVEDYINDGNSQESARALRLFRTINNRSFDMRIARLEEIEKFCEENGIRLPDEVIVEGEKIKVDLKAALIKMGDRRGYYMPRIRNKGEWVVYALKDGENPRTEYFDMKLRADFRRGQLENNGYRVTVKKAGNLSEDLFEQLGSVLSQQAIINESMEEINKGNKVVTLKDLDIKSWMDGDDLVMSGDFIQEFLPTLDKFEGEKKIKERYVGKSKVVTIEYRFKNAKKGLEEEISKELFKISGATNMFQEVATRFAKAFVSQYADIVRSRGSRSAMIGRSDKVGQEVNLGFEEDALTRVVRATLSLAGGEAKSRTALSMIEAISGRDVSWSKFSEIKRFKGAFEEFEKQVIDNDEQYIDRATFEEIKNNWVGAPQYPDYIEFIEGRGIDPALQKTAHAEAMALFKDMMRNEERADRVIGTLKGLAVLKYIGFRVAAPVVNMTNMVVGVPGAMAGYGKIPIRQAMKHIAKSFLEYRQFKKGELKNNTLKKVFEEIEKRGWDQAQFNHEGMAALQNKMQFGYAKIIETSMMMFTWSEKQNRVATISAAYKGLETSFPDLTFEERLLKAKEISDKAHGIYGKANRPSVVRGGSVGANILQMGYVFKTFTHNFLATMADLAINERDVKAVAWLLFSPAMFGLGASMGASWITSAIGSALGSDDPDEDLYKWVESTFGSYTENLARFGVFGALGDGISVKGSLNSVGVSDLPTSFKDLIGAPGSVVTDVIEGVGQLGRGNVMKGAESILPLAFGAPVKAYREYTEGITTKSNAPVFFEGQPLKADAIDAFLRALSFNPSRIAGAREKLWGEKVSEQAFMERRKDIYSRVKKYYLDTDRDPEDLQDIEIDIAAYNQRAKNSGQTVIKAKNIKSILKRAKIEE